MSADGPTATLARFAANLTFEDLPVEVVHQAKRMVLDTLCAGLGGYALPPAQIVLRHVRRLGGSPLSTIIGSGERTSPTNAAFANAMICNALDIDECWRYCAHPGVPALAAALAVGEQVGTTGKELLVALVAGYEVFARIFLASRHAIDISYGEWSEYDQLSAWHVFSAAVGASRVLRLTPEQVAEAIGIAGKTAPVGRVGRMSPREMVKYGTPWSTEQGVVAALLASDGFLGGQGYLEGDHGFWRISRAARCDFDAMGSGLGEDYEILKTSYKPYPACMWAQPGINGCLELMRAHGIAASEIGTIRCSTVGLITSGSMADFDAHASARHIVNLSVNTRYGIAVGVLGVPPGAGWFASELITSEALRDLIGRIELVRDRDLEKDLRWFAPTATVELETKDGRRFRTRTEPGTCKGDPGNPLTDRELEDKARTVADGVPGKVVDAIIGRVWELDKLESLDDLMRLLCADVRDGSKLPTGPERSTPC